MTKFISRFTAGIAFATSMSCIASACVEPSPNSDAEGEESDKNGGGTMSLRRSATTATFTCSEFFSCDIDIRAKRCASGGPTGRILGHLTLTNEDGDEVVVAEIMDKPYVWLIGTSQAGQYAYRISALSPRDSFTLAYEPTPPILPAPGAPPDQPLQPACVDLTLQWY